MPATFKSYLVAHPNLYKIIPSVRLFQLVQANLVIRNGTKFYSGGSIVDSFISTLVLADLVVYSSSIVEYGIKVTSSTATISKCSFYNLTSPDATDLIQVSFDSNVNMSSVRFYDSHLSFMHSLSSTVAVIGLSLSNLTSTTTILSFDGATKSSIRDSDIASISSPGRYPFIISSSVFTSIANLTISNISDSPVVVKKSSIASIDDLHVSKCASEVILESSFVAKFSNSQISGLGSNTTRKGGALLMINSNATIVNLTFTGNTALQGGAVYFSCAGLTRCSLDLSSSLFANNTGIDSGGAIQYDVYRPSIQNCKFEGNSAVYGPNIASYPIKIKVKGSAQDQVTLDNVRSGVSNKLSFVMALYDHDDQIDTLDSASQISIRSISTNTQVAGSTIVKVTKGVATFDDVIFTATPGLSNVSFELTSKAISLVVARKQYGQDYSLKNIVANFRYCKPGEIQANNICRSCSPGTYSLLWNSTECINCIGNAD